MLFAGLRKYVRQRWDKEAISNYYPGLKNMKRMFLLMRIVDDSQVISNLLIDVIKFTRGGDISIQC